MFGHIDCNNFYVSCERVFNPSLYGKPVIVLSNNDGCIIARSPEAKLIGITMGQPAFKAERLLKKHNVKVLSSNYTLYGDMSRRVMDILRRYCKGVEVYSIDEAFVDLSNIPEGELETYAKRLRATILKWTGLPVGVGVAPTKTLAKVANRLAKNSGSGVCCLVSPAETKAALHEFPVDEIWGIGPSHAWNLNRLGITNASTLVECTDAWIKDRMTVLGLRTVFELRGISCIPLNEDPEPREEVIVCRTFSRYLSAIDELKPAVASFAARAGERLRRDQLHAQSVTLFLETNRFNKGPQCHSAVSLDLDIPTDDTADLIFYGNEALTKLFQQGYDYKKAGIILGKLASNRFQQLSLFGDQQSAEKSAKLLSVVDAVNRSNGQGTIKFGAEVDDASWAGKSDYLSPRYTTRWSDIPKVA